MEWKCRFYESCYPALDDVIMVRVVGVQDLGVYVELLEYGGIQGMIPIHEVSRRRIRSIHKLLWPGKVECVTVIRIDPEKGYIDLSKRRVSPEESSLCQERFARNKVVSQIVRTVHQRLTTECDQYDVTPEDLYTDTVWLYDGRRGQPGAAYHVFKDAVSFPDLLLQCEVTDNTRNILHQVIVSKLKPPLYKINAVISVTCFEHGIDAIKEALCAGKRAVTDDVPLKITLTSSPMYEASLSCVDKTEGLSHINSVLDNIRHTIEALKGDFGIVSQPTVVAHGVTVHDEVD